MSEVPEEIGDPGIFGALFRLLEPSNDSGLRTKKTPYKFGGESIYAGRDARGNPHLLIPLVEDLGLSEEMLTSYIGFEKKELKHPSGSVVTFLDLFCLDTGVDELFSPICFDISEKLVSQPGISVVSIKAVLIEVIAKWREILKAFENSAAAGSEIVGLVGELLTLRALFTIMGNKALDGWVGQDKTRHDFEFESVAYEAKASTVQSRRTCQIHGLNQLGVSAGTILNLVHFQIERAAGDFSISNLVGELGELLGGKALVQSKIKHIWPDLEKEPSWFKTWTFKVTSASKYLVNDNFPKLTSDSIATQFSAHISNVSYNLNLEGIKPERLEEGQGWKNVCVE